MCVCEIKIGRLDVKDVSYFEAIGACKYLTPIESLIACVRKEEKETGIPSA